MAEKMLNSWGDPTPGSDLAQVNALYQWEKVSDRAQHYVAASLEHLLMWADFVAPLKFDPEQASVIRMRPTLALARAAIESAAQVVWLLAGQTSRECVRRHLSLVRWDLQEHRKSRLNAAGKQSVRRREQELVERVSSEFSDREVSAPQGYLWIIQQACTDPGLKLDGTEAERLWRAMSGAAHGMYWTNLELTQISLGEEYEPGHFRSLVLPDAGALIEALRAASTITTYATYKYLTMGGADCVELAKQAIHALAQEVPLKPNADMDLDSMFPKSP
ncbi:hypothetical protein [Nesterenkonia ebinurensis]|uniref:hypothetical protein n=1 Tax=Nesterenkonia ebinurensis TaxID=2608252 RepID=UPI00123CE99E|nr:hypothetical protein [Nesterenkonia ebinurensis]